MRFDDTLSVKQGLISLFTAIGFIAGGLPTKTIAATTRAPNPDYRSPGVRRENSVLASRGASGTRQNRLPAAAHIGAVAGFCSESDLIAIIAKNVS